LVGSLLCYSATAECPPRVGASERPEGKKGIGQRWVCWVVNRMSLLGGLGWMGLLTWTSAASRPGPRRCWRTRRWRRTHCSMSTQEGRIHKADCTESRHAFLRPPHDHHRLRPRPHPRRGATKRSATKCSSVSLVPSSWKVALSRFGPIAWRCRTPRCDDVSFVAGRSAPCKLAQHP
jgi:hypothetical protein